MNDALYSIISSAARSEAICNLTLSVWHDSIYEDFSVDTYKYTIKSNILEKHPDKDAAYWAGYVIGNENSFNGDFSTSINALYTSGDLDDYILFIKDKQEEITGYMKSLISPPDELSFCYSLLLDLYAEYDALTSLSLSPSGSYQSYSDSFTKCEEEISSLYSKLDVAIPDIPAQDSSITTRR